MKRTRHNDSDVDKVRIAANYYDLISVKITHETRAEISSIPAYVIKS